jgi:acyl-CoA dehydrogenase
MDVAGGYGICKGPRNVLAPIYESAPIGITVEGANILSRSLIIFGQGAIRCHPYALAEMRAIADADLVAFDAALSRHAGFMLRNVARSFVLAITGSAIARVPVGGRPGRVLRQLTRVSASFATIADAAMATLGGALKRAENLSGRMADALGWMYVASAITNRHVADPTDEVLYEWASREALWRAHIALRGVIENLPDRGVARALSLCIYPFGSRVRPPSDRLTFAAARRLVDDAAARHRLTAQMFVPAAHEPGLGQLEHALALAVAARPVRTRLREAARAGIATDGLDDALAKHVIDTGQRNLVRQAEAAVDEAIQVDAYSAEIAPLPRSGDGLSLRQLHPSTPGDH